MNRAGVIARAEEALRIAKSTPEAKVTGSDDHAFVRVTWGELSNPCTQEFPATSKAAAVRIVRVINGEVF